MLRLVAVTQGLYYLVTGIWPLVWMEGFLAVTGPKTDLWLVNTVGVLVIVIGAVLLLAAAQRQVTAAIALLATGSAAMLATVEGYYALRGVIWPIYLLDALAELALIVLWAVAWRKESSGSRVSRSSSTVRFPSAAGTA